MRLSHLLPLALVAKVSAESLTSILTKNNATLSTLSSTLYPRPVNQKAD
jgi:hypothetical protein